MSGAATGPPARTPAAPRARHAARPRLETPAAAGCTAAAAVGESACAGYSRRGLRGHRPRHGVCAPCAGRGVAWPPGRWSSADTGSPDTGPQRWDPAQAEPRPDRAGRPKRPAVASGEDRCPALRPGPPARTPAAPQRVTNTAAQNTRGRMPASGGWRGRLRPRVSRAAAGTDGARTRLLCETPAALVGSRSTAASWVCARHRGWPGRRAVGAVPTGTSDTGPQRWDPAQAEPRPDRAGRPKRPAVASGEDRCPALRPARRPGRPRPHSASRTQRLETDAAGITASGGWRGAARGAPPRQASARSAGRGWPGRRAVGAAPTWIARRPAAVGPSAG